MQTYLIAVIIVAVILAVFLLLFAFALICENMAFGKRCDKNPLLKYFSAEDFDLTAEPVTLPKGLRGYVYSKAEDRQKLIIFCHGMGAGHIAYTTEIAYFCNLGYAVLAVDNRGCNLSDGKSLKGMYSGVQTAIAAADYARKFLKPEKVYLIGHSWGAYSALCASRYRKVDGVVAISGPSSPSMCIKEVAARVITKPLAAVLRPFLKLTSFLKFGARGDLNAAKCAEKNKTPTLIIHGDNDKIVTPKISVYHNAQGENIRKMLAEGKAHNPYNTQNAESLLNELSKKLRSGDKDFSNFDFSAVTEEDEEVMKIISDFLADN